MEVFESFLGLKLQTCYFAKRLRQGCTEILDALQYSEDSLVCIFPDSLYSVRLVVILRLLVAVINLLASLNEIENYHFTGVQDSTTTT